MTTGLFIGRFQPFHKGHLHAIKKALDDIDEIIIGVGSSQYVNTEDNPFSVEERIDMIESTLAKEDIGNCTIFPVPDIGDDSRWVEHVEVLLPKFDVVFSGNEFVMKLFRKKGYKVKKVDFLEGVKGTDVRDRIIKNQDWKALVPEETFKVIDKAKGVKRIAAIFKRR